MPVLTASVDATNVNGRLGLFWPYRLIAQSSTAYGIFVPSEVGRARTAPQRPAGVRWLSRRYGFQRCF